MTHRLIASVRKADVTLKSAIFTGNFNIFPQVQPKRLELREFLSQLSSHPSKGFYRPFSQRIGNKSCPFTASGIAAERKSSSLSGGADDREGEEEKSKAGPGSDNNNKRKILSVIEGSNGVGWVYLNHKDLKIKDVVDNFLGRRTHLAQLVNAAKSTDPQIQCSAVNSLCELLYSGHKTPIDFVISSNILPTLVGCLSSQNRALQDDALRVLIKMMAGTLEQAQAVVEAGAVPHFLRLLTSPQKNVRESALDSLEYLIATGPQLRDCVLNVAVVASLLNCIRPDTKKNFLHKVLRITAWTLKLLTDGGKTQIQMIIDSGFLPKLVKLLNHGQVTVQEPALLAVGNIFVNGTNNQVKAALSCDALSHFRNLLNHSNKNISKIALYVLSNVAAINFTRVQTVIDAGLVPHIIHHLEKGEFQTQKAATYALSTMTMSGTKEQVEHVIDCGVFPLFINLLNCKDSEVVQKVLVGIHNILAKLSVSQVSGDKACTLIEECGGWDKIKTLQNHESMNICKIARDILLKFSSDN